MNYLKNLLCNCIGDEFLTGCVVTNIENDIFDSVESKTFNTIKI